MPIDVKTLVFQPGNTMQYRASEPWPEDEGAFQGIALVGPPDVDVTLKHLSNGKLRLTGRAMVCLQGSCARCTAPVQQKLTVDLAADFVPTDRGGPARRREDPFEAEASTEEEACYPYTGFAVELDALLRDAIYPAVPLRLLCAEDCRGLCPHCGADRNRHPCTCAETDGKKQSPFAGLMDLFKMEETKDGSTEEKMV